MGVLWVIFFCVCVCEYLYAPAVLSLKETHYTRNTHCGLCPQRGSKFAVLSRNLT